MSHPKKEAIEVCMFKLVDEAERQTFMRSNSDVDQWLKQQEGFMFRCLSEKEDGTWIDIVHWATMDAAQKAGDAFMAKFEQTDFLRVIDPESVTMNHAHVELAYPAA